MNASTRSAAKRKRKSYRSYGTQTRVPRVLSNKTPLPVHLFTKTRYSEVISWDLAALALGTYTFRCNDLYDPNVTGAGHQPMGFDQLMGLYTKFTVLKSKITIKFNSDDTAVSTSYWFGVRKITTNTAPTDFDEVVETDGTMFGGFNVGMGSLTLKNNYSLKGDNPTSKWSDNDMWGLSSSSPSNLHHFQIAAQGAGTSNPGVVQMRVLIEYDVVYHDPVALIRSQCVFNVNKSVCVDLNSSAQVPLKDKMNFDSQSVGG